MERAGKREEELSASFPVASSEISYSEETRVINALLEMSKIQREMTQMSSRRGQAGVVMSRVQGIILGSGFLTNSRRKGGRTEQLWLGSLSE